MTRVLAASSLAMVTAMSILLLPNTALPQSGTPKVVISKRPAKIVTSAVDKWVTVTGKSAGVDLSAQDRAIANALRKAVEQACGTFISAQSQTKDYKLVYDKVFANTVGYVREHRTPSIWTEGKVTYAKLDARVSTRKFEQSWATIAHTVAREGNPRVIIAVTDADWARATVATAPPVIEEIPADQRTMTAGVAQAVLEEFFLSKGLQLMDKATSIKVGKRDIILAGLADDLNALAAAGARYNADVVVFGQASTRRGSTIQIAGHNAYKCIAALNVRAIRTDSAQLLVSKSFGPVTETSLNRSAGPESAMKKLAVQAAPSLLATVVEAWRKQVHVTRNTTLHVRGMDFTAWQTFRTEAVKLREIKELRLREIVENVANIDVEHNLNTQQLADMLTKLKKSKLVVTEFSPNRLKLKLSASKALAPDPSK